MGSDAHGSDDLECSLPNPECLMPDVTPASTATNQNDGAPTTVLSLDATRAAYERHREVHESNDWQQLAALFAEDASYFDVFYGWSHGRPAIADFMRRAMGGLEGWTFPISWQAVAPGRVVVHWHNRLPGRRPDGSYYEFPGMSAITFGPDGEIVEQQDIYDRIATLQVIASSRTGALGRAVAWLWNRVGAAMLSLSHKAVASTE